MDFEELMHYQFRTTPVKSTPVKSEFDFEDPSLIDQVLGKPNKIDIPDRYIPDVRVPEEPEEEIKRSQTADRLRRLLSKSNCAGPLPLVLPHPSKQQHSNLGYNRSRQSGNESASTSGLGAPDRISASESLGVNNFQSSSRRPLSSSLKKASSSSRLYRNTTRTNSSNCDWSLAGVSAPSSPHPSSSLTHHSYYSSSSNSNLYAPNQTATSSATKPSHSYHSSYSSTSSGRSSSDREELLHLQHNLAREVTEKSRLVAVRALATPSPTPFRNYSGSRYREPSPPSPIDLPTIQQREGFFT